MASYPCHLCKTIVYDVERHPCFFYMNDENVYMHQQFDEIHAKHGEAEPNLDDVSKQVFSSINRSENEVFEQIKLWPPKNNEETLFRNNRTWERKYFSTHEEASNNLKGDFNFLKYQIVDELLHEASSEVRNGSNSGVLNACGYVNPLNDEDPLEGTSTMHTQMGSQTDFEAIFKTDCFGEYPNNCYKNWDSLSTVNTKESKQEFVNYCQVRVSMNEEDSPGGNLTMHTRMENQGENLYLVKQQCEESSLPNTQSKAGGRSHKGEKHFPCQDCGKMFLQKRYLDNHIGVHTGEKPFSCDVCGDTFSRRSKLTRHYFTHSGEKPFSCDVCGDTFSQKGNLTRHFLTHSGEKPFSCDVCGYTFSQKGHLTRHFLTHSGEKPFSCDVCGYTFSQRGNLTKHSLTHSGEKPFL